MVTQREAIDVIAYALQSHDAFPDVSYLLHEADPDNADASVELPVVEITTESVERDDPSNNNLHEYITDDGGNRVGRVYESKWLMNLQLNIWTVEGSDNDVDELARLLREVLYTYDVRGPDHDFFDRDGNAVDSIYEFSLQSGQRQDSLIETPTVRLWQQTARVRGAEYLTTHADEPPVKSITETVDTQ